MVVTILANAGYSVTESRPGRVRGQLVDRLRDPERPAPGARQPARSPTTTSRDPHRRQAVVNDNGGGASASNHGGCHRWGPSLGSISGSMPDRHTTSANAGHSVPSPEDPRGQRMLSAGCANATWSPSAPRGLARPPTMIDYRRSRSASTSINDNGGTATVANFTPTVSDTAVPVSGASNSTSSALTVTLGTLIPLRPGSTTVTVTGDGIHCTMTASCVRPGTHCATPSTERSPSTSGTKIAFSRTRDGNSEIYLMNADGTGQTRLTTNAPTTDFPPGRPTAPGSRSAATATATTRSTA